MPVCSGIAAIDVALDLLSLAPDMWEIWGIRGSGKCEDPFYRDSRSGNFAELRVPLIRRNNRVRPSLNRVNAEAHFPVSRTWNVVGLRPFLIVVKAYHHHSSGAHTFSPRPNVRMLVLFIASVIVVGSRIPAS